MNYELGANNQMLMNLSTTSLKNAKLVRWCLENMEFLKHFSGDFYTIPENPIDTFVHRYFYIRFLIPCGYTVVTQVEIRKIVPYRDYLNLNNHDKLVSELYADLVQEVVKKAHKNIYTTNYIVSVGEFERIIYKDKDVAYAIDKFIRAHRLEYYVDVIEDYIFKRREEWLIRNKNNASKICAMRVCKFKNELIHVASQLNGNNGEATNTDDIKKGAKGGKNIARNSEKTRNNNEGNKKNAIKVCDKSLRKEACKNREHYHVKQAPKHKKFDGAKRRLAMGTPLCKPASKLELCVIPNCYELFPDYLHWHVNKKRERENVSLSPEEKVMEGYKDTEIYRQAKFQKIEEKESLDSFGSDKSVSDLTRSNHNSESDDDDLTVDSEDSSDIVVDGPEKVVPGVSVNGISQIVPPKENLQKEHKENKKHFSKNKRPIDYSKIIRDEEKEPAKEMPKINIPQDNFKVACYCVSCGVLMQVSRILKASVDKGRLPPIRCGVCRKLEKEEEEKMRKFVEEAEEKRKRHEFIMRRREEVIEIVRQHNERKLHPPNYNKKVIEEKNDDSSGSLGSSELALIVLEEKEDDVSDISFASSIGTFAISEEKEDEESDVTLARLFDEKNVVDGKRMMLLRRYAIKKDRSIASSESDYGSIIDTTEDGTHTPASIVIPPITEDVSEIPPPETTEHSEIDDTYTLVTIALNIEAHKTATTLREYFSQVYDYFFTAEKVDIAPLKQYVDRPSEMQFYHKNMKQKSANNFGKLINYLWHSKNNRITSQFTSHTGSNKFTDMTTNLWNSHAEVYIFTKLAKHLSMVCSTMSIGDYTGKGIFTWAPKRIQEEISKLDQNYFLPKYRMETLFTIIHIYNHLVITHQYLASGIPRSSTNELVARTLKNTIG